MPASKKPRQQPALEKTSQPRLETYGTEDTPEDDPSDSTQIPPPSTGPKHPTCAATEDKDTNLQHDSRHQGR